LVLLRKRDFLRDSKRAALKKNIEFKKKAPKIYDNLNHTSTLVRPENIAKEEEQVQNEIYAYKVAK
jgi:hypothetical protein